VVGNIDAFEICIDILGAGDGIYSKYPCSELWDRVVWSKWTNVHRNLLVL